MKSKFFPKAVSLFLSAVLIVGILPMSVLAIESEIAELSGDEQVMTYQSFESTLAPGIVQTVNSGYGADGKLINYYIAIADINRDDVGVQASYKDAQCEKLGMSKMTEQAAAMNAKHTNADDEANYIPHYAVVAGVNGDGYNTGSAMPSGAHIMNGISGFGIQKAANSSWFAIFEDGTALCGANNADWDEAVAAHGPAQEAIGGFQLVRKNGTNIAYSNSSYLNDGRYPRSFVGVTADNKVVFMVADGNGSGGSAGTNYAESLEIMDEAGCTYILCLDGGGSATYVSRSAGSNDIQVTSNPSDGSERAVSNGLVMYTSTPPSDVFEKAEVSAENYYVTPGSEVKVSAIGISPAGTAAEIPENAVWTATNGIVENGVFISDGTVGAAEISLTVDGETVGSATINIVLPDAVSFTRETVTVPFGATVELEVSAKYGLFDVAVKDSDFSFTVADTAVGNVSGNKFTAAETGVGTTVTVSVNGADPAVTDTIDVKLGKGSEVIFDFEEGTAGANLDNWTTRDHGSNTHIFTDLSIVTKETGMVHDGDSALAFNYHMDQSIHGTEFWAGNSIAWLGESIELKNATSWGFWLYIPEDCTQLAMWVGTATHDAEGNFNGWTGYECVEYTQEKYATPEYSGWHYITVPVTKEAVYIEDNADQVGKYFNGTQYKQKANCFIKFYAVNIDSWNEGETNYAGDFTFYIDNITVDYSDAVDDRENPIFSGMTYAVEGMSDAAALNGQTVIKNTVSFAALVSEDMTNPNNASGLDAASAVAYIDGVGVDCEYANGMITVSDAVLTNGVHTIRMGICDKMGNYSETKRQITVKAEDNDKTVRVVPQDSSLIYMLNDSVYWIDVEVDEIETVKSVEMRLDLDSMNNWELDYIDTLYGFDCEYSFATANDRAENILTIKFTRNEEYLSETGTAVIASLPVRVWEYVSSDDHTHKNAVDAWNCSYVCAPALSVDVDTEMGVVTYLDGTSHTFSSEDIHTLCVSYTYGLRMRDYNNEYYKSHSFHVHSAVAIDDCVETCTESGYTGRTWCATCDSPVDWGKTVEATGHNFELAYGVLKCACGELFNGVYTDGKTYVDGVVNNGWIADSYWADGVKFTGVKFVDGYYYNFGEDGVCAGQTKFTGKFFNETANGYCYAVSGELKNGWYLVDGIWNYFRWDEKTAITGTYKFANGSCAGITYVFDDEGNLTDGVWHTTEDGNIQYFYGPDCYKWSNNILQEIDGKTYCFDKDGYLYRGHQVVRIGAFAEYKLYHFDDVTGELIKVYEDETGIFPVSGGNYCYLVDGVVQMGLGMITVDGAQYYVRGNGLLAVGKYYIGAGYTGCGHLTPGYYDFGDDAKFVGPWIDETAFTGIKADDEGDLHYYKYGVIQKGLGMIIVDGDQYYVRGNGLLAVSKYYIGEGYTGCSHLSPGFYNFGEDGKFVGPWINENAFTGIKADDEGNLHYYVYDVIQKGLGMITLDGSEYYVRGNGLLAVGKYYIGVGYTGCGHLTPGYYEFGEDGKFVGPWVDENAFTGIKADDEGNLHYYVNDLVQSGLGMITIDGADYYVRGNGLLAVGKYYIGVGYTGCGHLTPGYYDFGEDGKFVGPWSDENAFTGIKADSEGNLHYYVNDAIQSGLGMITVDGADYYVRGNGLLAVGKYYVGAGYTGCGHLTPGYYDFGEDGKFVGPWSE